MKNDKTVCKTCNDTGKGIHPLTKQISYCLNPDCRFGRMNIKGLEFLYEYATVNVDTQ